MAAIQLKKYEPLPNLTVQGNQWQAPNVSLAPVVAPPQNISVPNNPYQGPGNTWGAPMMPPPSLAERTGNFLHPYSNFITNPTQPIRSLGGRLTSSPAANIIRLGAAELTQNPVAIKQAKLHLGESANRAAKEVQQSAIYGGFGEGGIGKPGELPKVRLNGKPISKGAVGKNVNKPNVPEVPLVSPGHYQQGLSKAELDMGRALGLKPKQIAEAKAANSLPKVVSTAASKMSPEELNALKPGTQMAVDQLRGAGPPSKEQIAAGMKANPYKSNVHAIEPGNWVAARTAGDAVSSPIMHAAKFTNFHLKQLSKKDPGLYQRFWHIVETGKVPSDAPASLKDAVRWFRETANGIHKESNTLGTPTPYKQNWELRAASLKDTTPEQIATGELGSIAKHTLQRKYATHEEFVRAAEKAGLQVEKDPRKALQKYVTATTSALQRKALAKALAEADRANLTKPHTIDLGWGTTVQLSDEGLHQAKGILPIKAKKTKFGTVYDATNSFRKGLLLSVSKFHTVNIVGLRAAPSLLMPKPGYLLHGDLTLGVHPVRAAKAVGGATRAALPGGGKVVNRKLEEAYARGDIQFAARHGSPIGQSSYGASQHFNLGHKQVFEKELPMAHIQVIGALRRDLKKFNIPEGSPQAMEAGKVATFTMGFMNRAAMNISPTVVKGIERTMLAGQFTPSKFANLYKGTTKLGLAGSMARADVAANAISAAAMIVGIGWLVRQKSDDVRDMVLRAIVDPAIPTNVQDKPKYPGAETNTQEVRIPMTYTAEIAHLLGIKLVRQQDGHLGVDFSPKNMPETTAAWARSRLSPNLGDVVKVGTNTEFGNKPLYEEGASRGKQAIQVATKTVQGGLPIGLQGLGYTETVKKHLPASSREVLDAGTPSTNPLLKSLTSSAGFTLRTDKTVGKALNTTTYFDNVNWALSQAKGTGEKTAIQNYLGSKKNSVTGKYDTLPNVNDTRRKAMDLLDAPGSIDVLMKMNQKLIDKGQKVDPLWSRSKDEIVKFFQRQAMPYGGPDRKKWYNDNKSWYEPLSKEQTKFYDSLPAGDPNKPKAPIEYPSASDAVSQKMDEYFAIEDPIKASQFIRDNPDLQDQFDKLSQYNNAMRKAQGYGELDSYPKPTPEIQKLMDTYNALPKNDGPRGGSKTRSLWIQAHPTEWAAMTQAWTQQSLYNLENDAGQAAFKDAGFSQKGLKAIYNLGQYDVKKTTDANGNTFYALGDGTSSSGSGSSYKGGTGSGPHIKGSLNSRKYAVSLKAGGAAPKPRVSVSAPKISKAKKYKVSKPKVTLKKTS